MIEKTRIYPLMRMGNIIRDILFPLKCSVCGSFFQHLKNRGKNHFFSKFSRKQDDVSGYYSEPAEICFKQVLKDLICPACLDEFEAIETPICLECGIMFKSREGDNHVCGACIHEPKKFQMARAAGVYTGSLMSVIHVFKYNGKIQLASPLAMMLLNTFMTYWRLSEIDTIIPVPLHIKKIRSRGFNQAFLLIKDWLSLIHTIERNQVNIQIDIKSLTRSKWTEPQIGLGRKKRLKNVKNAFEIKDKSRIKGKRILLVDDVYTTGATVNECARILIKNGAANVKVLTLARTI